MGMYTIPQVSLRMPQLSTSLRREEGGKSCSNHRGIFLLIIAGKLVDGVLLQKQPTKEVPSRVSVWLFRWAGDTSDYGFPSINHAVSQGFCQRCVHFHMSSSSYCIHLFIIFMAMRFCILIGYEYSTFERIPTFYMCFFPRHRHRGLNLYLPTQTPGGRPWWPFAITSLTALFIYCLVSDLVTCHHRKEYTNIVNVVLCVLTETKRHQTILYLAEFQMSVTT